MLVALARQPTEPGVRSYRVLIRRSSCRVGAHLVPYGKRGGVPAALVRSAVRYNELAGPAIFRTICIVGE